MTPPPNQNPRVHSGNISKRRAFIKIIANGIGLLLVGGILLYLAIYTIVLAVGTPETAGAAFLRSVIGLIFAVGVVTLFRKILKR
jgi:hypothetical protein